MKAYALTALMLAASSTAAWAGEVSTPPNAVYKSNVLPQDRRVFFGELHLHTTESFDAWIWGTKVTPDQAYKFARGETIMVPAGQYGRQNVAGFDKAVPARRAWPLDFTAVTDHSEYMGALHELDDPNSAFSKSELGAKIRGLGKGAFRFIVNMQQNNPKALEGAAKESGVWAIEQKAANDNYEPGKFTTFIGYEWSETPGERHLHRNVIFNADHAPAPFTSLDSSKPEDLWKYIDGVHAQGIDAIAIPHNANLSGGLMFDWNMSNGKPMDADYAQQRMLHEPLTEIVQNKGQSDTRPELSPNDEFANFEVIDHIYAGEKEASLHHGASVREAYGRGLIIQSRVGVNPFRMGVVGGSDYHNGLSASDENATVGGFGPLDPKTMALSDPEKRLNEQPGAVKGAGKLGQNNLVTLSSAGITGVWAEENNRNSIFAALKRKETFATSGTRIRVRMFASWNYAPGLLSKPSWVATAYRDGVPMGSDLPARPKDAGAPTFLLQASKDPDGANLDRIQIIKVWLEGSEYKEKVFDIALSDNRKDDPKTGHAPPVGNTVDLTTGKYTNTIGAATLSGEWTDPEFDASKPAVYYARVLEIPTPRWSTLVALKYHLPFSTEVPATIQERAWGSPVWYTPVVH
jgi:hypothetical protein